MIMNMKNKAVNYYNQNAGKVSMADCAKKFNVDEVDILMALSAGQVAFKGF